MKTTNPPNLCGPKQRWLWCARVVALVVVVGCGEQRSDLAQVRGTVKLDGQPLAKALVEYIPQGTQGVVSIGRTDERGNYEMQATQSATGASLGINKVRITTFEILDDNGKQSIVKERVPTKYNKATELTVTVKAERNMFDFDLVTAGGKIEKADERPANIQ